MSSCLPDAVDLNLLPLKQGRQLTAEGQSGALALLEGGKRTITLGPTKQKSVPALRAYNDGKMLMAAGATPAGTGAVVVYGGDDNIGAGLQGYSGGGGDVFASADGKDLVTLQGRSSGGTMPVATALLSIASMIKRPSAVADRAAFSFPRIRIHTQQRFHRASFAKTSASNIA